MIIKGEIEGRTKSEIHASSYKMVNLTTAASLWYSGAIGMAIGSNYHFIALVSFGFVVLVSHLPKIKKMEESNDE